MIGVGAALAIIAFGFAIWLILGGPTGFLSKIIANRHELKLRREEQKEKQLEIDKMTVEAELLKAERARGIPWHVDVTDPDQVAAFREVQLAAARRTSRTKE